MRHPLVPLIVVTLLLGAPALAAPAPAPAADEQAWQRLVDERTAFGKKQPAEVSEAGMAAFLGEYSKSAAALADQFKAFLAQHPSSEHAGEAWESWMDFLSLAAQRIPERKAELERTEKEQLADAKLPRERREAIRTSQVDRTVDPVERERLIRAVKGDFAEPDVFFCDQMLTLTRGLDHKRATEVADEVLAPAQGKAKLSYFEIGAKQIKSLLARVGKPVDLRFTTLDGHAIDLKDYRGKVVLVDFWATWCPPCVAGMPKVNALWKAHKDAGFEVIGISYDTERDVMEAFLRENGFLWPQFFDKDGPDAKLVRSLGAPDPPSYWLIDRKGILVDVNAAMNLESKLKDLLSKSKE